MKNSISLKIFLYLIFIILPSYLIGIAVTEFLVISLIIAFFFLNKNFKYFKNLMFIFLIFFSFLVTLSGIINLDYIDLKIASLTHIRFAIFSLVIFYFLKKLLNKETNINNNFLKLYLLIISFVIFDSLIQFFFGTNLFGQEIQKSRISGIFGDDLILGSFLLQILPLTLLLLLFFNVDIKKKQIQLTIFFSFYLITIYIAGGRTPFFLTILFVITLLLFEKNFRKVILKCLSILTIFIICEAHFKFGKTRLFHKFFVITFIQITDYHYHPKDKLDDSNSLITEKAYKKDTLNKLPLKNKVNEFLDSLVIFSENHQNHYVLAIKLFKEKPILGNGPKGFRNYCRSVQYNSPSGICSTHPHNYFFQILSELGLVGIFFYLFGLFFILFKFIKNQYFRSHNLIISSFRIISLGLLVLLFPLVPSGNFFNNWVSISNYYYIGIYFYLYDQIKIKKLQYNFS